MPPPPPPAPIRWPASVTCASRGYSTRTFFLNTHNSFFVCLFICLFCLLRWFTYNEQNSADQVAAPVRVDRRRHMLHLHGLQVQHDPRMHAQLLRELHQGVAGDQSPVSGVSLQVGREGRVHIGRQARLLSHPRGDVQQFVRLDTVAARNGGKDSCRHHGRHRRQ